MKEIEAFEAKNKFGQGLDRVERVEKVVITWRGKIVARLGPAPEGVDIRAAQEGAMRIRARRKGVTLGGLKIKDLITEGRR